jgi:hypothetical protein
MGEMAERIPVFAEAQMLPRSTANLLELRTSVTRPTAHVLPLLHGGPCSWS